MALEDLTTYIEVDSAGDLIITSPKVAFDTIRRDANSAVYKDFGASFFGDFRHDLEFEITAETSTNASCAIWGLNDTIAGATIGDFVAANVGMTMSVNGSTQVLTLIEYLTDTSDEFNFSLNTVYYLSVIRDATTMKCFVYSDSDRTILLDTLTITLRTHSRYLNAFCSRDSGSNPAANMTGYMQNLDLNPAAGAIINQFQGPNMGTDLFNGSFLG